MNYIFLIAPSFFITFCSIWLVRRLAFKNNWYVNPSINRWHKEPTALHGGIGFIPIMLCLQVYFVAKLGMNTPNIFWALILGVAFNFCLGWIDDIRPLGAFKKLFFQIIASSFFIHSGGSINFFSNELINILISYLWFIIIINSLNMLDNMDGLAIGVSCISIIFLVAVSYSSSSLSLNPIVILLGIISVASMAAFWLFNFNPASIFMGDSGSLSIGYILAAFTIPGEINFSYGVSNSSSLESLIIFLIPLALLSTQIFDFCFVTISRLLRGIKPYIGGKDHSSHGFALLGLNDKYAVYILYLLSVLGGILALTLKIYLLKALPFFLAYFIFLISLGCVLRFLVNKKSNEIIST